MVLKIALALSVTGCVVLYNLYRRAKKDAEGERALNKFYIKKLEELDASKNLMRQLTETALERNLRIIAEGSNRESKEIACKAIQAISELKKSNLKGTY